MIALGNVKNFAGFPFEVDGCGEFVALEEDENPEKFGLELIVEYPEKAELEAVLAVGLPGCTICGKA